MTSSDFENEASEPVKAFCEGERLHVHLRDGREIATPLWWYPFLNGSSEEQLNAIELHYSGLWWDHIDEGVSVKGLLLGWKAPDAIEPREAA